MKNIQYLASTQAELTQIETARTLHSQRYSRKSKTVGKVMIDTSLSGLLWTQAHLPNAAYVDAIWAARYPNFANGNEPKARGTWPLVRVQPASALPLVKWPVPNATNVTAFKTMRQNAGPDRIAGAVAQIAKQVRRQAKAI